MDKGAHGREEPSGSTSISEIDLFAFRGNGQRATTTSNDNGLPAVFPSELCSLIYESVTVWNRGFRSTYLQFHECIHHDLSIVRVKEVLEPACSSAEGGQQEGTVRNALGSGGGHSNRIMGGNTGDDLTSLGKDFSDDGIGDTGGLLLIGCADPGKDDNLFHRTTVLLVDLHDIEKPVDGDKLGGGNASDTGVVG